MVKIVELEQGVYVAPQLTEADFAEIAAMGFRAVVDNRPDGEASGTEWRTAPLWGIGLTKTVSGHTLFLHDGRARNITEAILWHGGEAQKARDAFVNLPKEDRERLLAFVNSL